MNVSSQLEQIKFLARFAAHVAQLLETLTNVNQTVSNRALNSKSLNYNTDYNVPEKPCLIC